MAEIAAKPPEAHEAWIRLHVAIERRATAESAAAEAIKQWDQALIEAAEHWDIETIAEMLGVSKGTAYGRLHNARHREFNRGWDQREAERLGDSSER